MPSCHGICKMDCVYKCSGFDSSPINIGGEVIWNQM